ncbi:F-box/WD repeat-containing protein 10 [Plakobranchus ocellatus]|uniref:F-box/WD repeat-containing protein 10 n=1 Tax=Plakobranchus ocellatus TaxID=259542 RepID=A0AAV4BSA7_9GAST|nr:F-box/WD repeat-containing protein 10 [Plakobranchus ocellatus]
MLEVMKPMDASSAVRPQAGKPCHTHNAFSSLPKTLSEAMKHPSPQREDCEFNLGKALELRCVNSGKTTVCGECETCTLTHKLRDVREWFSRFGDHSKKRFMLGLLRRTRSIDMLKNLVLLLQPTLNKDYTYARSRTNPSLETDTATLSSDRAISASTVEQITISMWEWFSRANYWTKMNFALSLLQMCAVHLLHTLYTQARTLLASELKAAESLAEENFYEASSVTSTEYTHHSEDHPELELLSMSRTDYSAIVENPFTGESVTLPVGAFGNKNTNRIAGGAAGSHDSASISEDTGTLDPMILVIPTSAKAYAGVQKYKDFIRCLPVHLAKLILSKLDMASLYNALCVSPNWRKLAEEVRLEFGVNQQLKEEVMLMQGAAAHGANPVYANDIDVLVPNLEPGTHQVLRTSDDVIETTFKSEISFETAFSGVSTKKVIMEERNVYCGAYNVMVVVDAEDSHRVMHTDGSHLIALGSKDRKVRFIDCDSGKETGPLITGHAGSVRCCFLVQDKGIVLSGSYDTSVRCWSIETGQCLKILRGHQDTVMCITVLGDVVATGAKDNRCKIWSLETGKSKQTFKHRAPVLAVALSDEMCISGCEAGRVKVWELRSGDLIKVLTGHHGPVTGIKFDRWHIITASRDGYALAWSALGRHSRCLTAFRHPKEVLCLEFKYLRVITGSADGRLRIWNMVTGQCCRIMRGNSRSDPILSIIAIADRITVNTLNNLLVMNFEPVQWDYSLETDHVPPLVQYGSYSDAPVRAQPYSYIRAQRMKKAGAANTKIVHHDSPPPEPTTGQVLLQHQYRAAQLPHSAKGLSTRSLESAKQIQSSPWRPDTALFSSPEQSLCESPRQDKREMVETYVATTGKRTVHPPPTQSQASGGKYKSRVRSAPSQFSVTIKETPDEDDSDVTREVTHMGRRISWAFDKPLVPKDKDISLSEMKSLLRSQIRMKAESVVPPDFIYLTVSTIQKSMVDSETNHNTKANMQDWKPRAVTLRKRPNSSPSRIDPRTKVPVDQLGLDTLLSEDGTMSEVSDHRSSIRSVKPKEQPKPPPVPEKESFSTMCTSTPVTPSQKNRMHPERTRTTVPRGRIIRPISAGPLGVDEDGNRTGSTMHAHPVAHRPPRPVTAPVKVRPMSVKSVPASIAPSLPGAGSFSTRPRSQPMSSSAHEANCNVPMLMYPREVREKAAALREQRKSRQAPMQLGSDGRPLGRVSMYNQPMREHVTFELRTHQQEEEHMANIEKLYTDQKRKEQLQQDKQRRAVWLAVATGNLSS